MSADEPKMTEPVEAAMTEQPQEQIQIDAGTAFALKLQEYDKKISAAEVEVAKLKAEKSDYIYTQNVQQIVAAHKEKVVKVQIEEEARKKLAEQK